MPTLKEKRKSIQELIYKVFNTLDKTGENTEKYKKFFEKMSDEQFSKWADNFFLEVLPYKNEPKLSDIYQTLKILDIPTREYVTLPFQNGVTTSKPVPVGYVLCKRHQQILSKKNNIADDISIRNPKTGQVTGESKGARESDMEVYSLKAFGANQVIREILGARADNMKAKNQMYEKINTEGVVSLEDLSNNKEDKVTLNTINTMYLGAGIRTNLIRDDLLLPATLDKREKRK